MYVVPYPTFLISILFMCAIKVFVLYCYICVVFVFSRNKSFTKRGKTEFVNFPVLLMVQSTTTRNMPKIQRYIKVELKLKYPSFTCHSKSKPPENSALRSVYFVRSKTHVLNYNFHYFSARFYDDIPNFS